MLHEEAAIVRRVLEAVTQALSFELAEYGWVNQAAGQLEFQYRVWAATFEAIDRRLPLTGLGVNGLGVAVVRSGEALNIPDVTLDPRYLVGQIGWSGRSALCVPLMIDQRVIGVLNVESQAVNAFTPADQQLLQTLADQAAVALYHAGHYGEIQWRLQEQMALRRAAALMSSTLDLNTVLRFIAEQLCQAVEATSVFISSYDPDAVTATIIAEYFSPQASPQEEGSVLGVVYNLIEVFPDDIELLQAGQPKVRQVDDPLLSLPQRQHLTQYGCQTVLDIPMQIGGRSIAYASIWESRRRREFTAEEIALCQAIAQQGAINLQNAQLHQAERARFHEAEALRRAALALTSTIDLNQLLERILIELKQVVPYDTASVQLLKGDYLEVIGGHGFDDPDMVVGAKFAVQSETIPNTHVILSLEPIIIEDVKAGSIFFDQALPGTKHIRGWLGVPLVINNRSIGMITLDKQQPNFYTPAHARTAMAYAAQAALALENARLYKNLQDQVQALRATQAQLMQSERMAALGRLIASIAHEINNPFQAIQGFFHLLTEELAGQRRPEKISYYLGIADSEIERIATIINRMRTFYPPTYQVEIQPDATGDFFNLDPTQLQAVDLHAILESVLQLTRKKLQQSNIKVDQAWAQNLPLLQANPDFLKQVFLNLTLNAIDAMADHGGVLRIETRLDQAPTGSNSPYSWICLRFNDSGVGMSPEMASRLFEPLFSTKEQGSGLGLFTSYQIIQAHQGQITATSQVGEGTTFTILLPLR